MGHMKKYKCPTCLSTKSVVKYGYRKQSHRFLCRKCKKHFSVNPHFINRKAILNDHLDGLSYRKLALKYYVSKTTAHRICLRQLELLPDNNKFTFRYCNRFSSTFVFDGKYFNVRGYKYDMVLLWGVDYFKHDIPVFTVSTSENYHSWSRLFCYLRIINRFPQLVVCDDNTNLKIAARNAFPRVKIQTCLNHFKENIRRDLRVRSEGRYKEFMKRVESILSEKISDDNFNQWLWRLYKENKEDPVCRSVLLNIEKHRQELLGYRGISGAPLTTNLIEGMNSHLESRLFSLKSFQSPRYARLWLNGYILKRRFTKFTDCRGKFRFLNGKTGIEMTKKPGVDLPRYFY